MKLPNPFQKRTSPVEALSRELGDIAVRSFPAAVTRILAMLRQEDTSMQEIGDVLQNDPGLHVRVLRTVNSPAYGFSSKVETIQRAVTLMGRSRLESLVLSVAVKDNLPRAGTARFDDGAFWGAAARRASVARSLARHLHSDSETESFTAGLLQDIAVPVLVAAKKGLYCEVYDRWRSDPTVELPVIERETFGFDHQSVGVAIAQRWELPDYLVQAIGGHHSTDAEPPTEAAVRLVSHIRDSATHAGTEALVEACVEIGTLSRDEVEKLVAEAFEAAEELRSALS